MTTLMENDTPNLADAPEAPIPFRTIATFEAPARFDVHQVPAFERWVAEVSRADPHRLVIDCSSIAFIDVAALEAIESARAVHRIELADPSVAVVITLSLLEAVAAGSMILEAA